MTEEQQQIIRDEGVRLFPYVDCCGKSWRECACPDPGKLTIGVGRNLDDVGITYDEAHFLFRNDLVRTRSALLPALPWIEFLPAPRRAVFVNMAFNLGLKGLLSFKRMLAAAQAGVWRAAADHLLDSKYAKQVKGRAVRLAKQLVTSEWQ